MRAWELVVVVGSGVHGGWACVLTIRYQGGWYPIGLELDAELMEPRPGAGMVFGDTGFEEQSTNSPAWGGRERCLMPGSGRAAQEGDGQADD